MISAKTTNIINYLGRNKSSILKTISTHQQLTYNNQQSLLKWELASDAAESENISQLCSYAVSTIHIVLRYY